MLYMVIEHLREGGAAENSPRERR